MACCTVGAAPSPLSGIRSTPSAGARHRVLHARSRHFCSTRPLRSNSARHLWKSARKRDRPLRKPFPRACPPPRSTKTTCSAALRSCCSIPLACAGTRRPSSIRSDTLSSISRHGNARILEGSFLWNRFARVLMMSAHRTVPQFGLPAGPPSVSQRRPSAPLSSSWRLPLYAHAETGSRPHLSAITMNDAVEAYQKGDCRESIRRFSAALQQQEHPPCSTAGHGLSELQPASERRPSL